MESFLIREKNTLLDYTELQLLPFVAPVCNAEVSIVLFSKWKNLKETAWPPLDWQDWRFSKILLSPVCFHQSDNDI